VSRGGRLATAVSAVHILTMFSDFTLSTPSQLAGTLIDWSGHVVELLRLETAGQSETTQIA